MSSRTAIALRPWASMDAEALDKLDDGRGRVVLKGRGEFSAADIPATSANWASPSPPCWTARDIIGDQGGECGAAGLGLDADGGQGAGERP